MELQPQTVLRFFLLCVISNSVSALSNPSLCPDKVSIQVRVIDKAGSSDKIQKLYLETKKGLVSKTVPAFGGLELVASGPEPLVWSYHGVGVSMSGTTSVSQTSNDGCYESKFRQDGATVLRAENTGLYTAKAGGAGKGLREASLHLYVPNEYPPYLMNTEHVQTVQLKEGLPLTLPCLQNNPSIGVTFAKRIGLNEWREVERPQDYHYSRQEGFVLKKPVPGSKSLYGSYKCFTPLHNRNDTVFIYVTD